MKITVEFKSNKGDTRVATFDEGSGVSTMGPHTTKFWRDGNDVTLESTPEGPMTLTMDNVVPQAGPTPLPQATAARRASFPSHESTRLGKRSHGAHIIAPWATTSPTMQRPTQRATDGSVIRSLKSPSK